MRRPSSGRYVRPCETPRGHGVLITGAARGIGAATARRLASEGARVLVTDIDTDAAEETAASIDGAEPFPCDVGDRGSVEAAVAHAVERFGTLDVLVNNALSAARDTELFEDLPTRTGRATSTSA